MKSTRSHQQGFSMTELLAAVAIGTMVALLLMTSYSDIMSRFLSLRNKSELVQDGIVVTDAIANEIKNVAGGIQPLATLLKIENNCGAAPPLPACLPGFGGQAGLKSDRLITFEFNSNLPECQVIDVANASPINPIYSFRVGSVCCLTPEMNKKHFILSVTPYYRFGFAKVDMNQCRLTFESSRYSSRFDRTTVDGVTNTDWLGANVSFVTPYEYYLHDLGANDGNRELRRFSDRDNDNAISTSTDPLLRELDILSEGVYDFQAAFGYDLYDQAGTVGASDGVAENKDSSNDEWLYNHSGDSLANSPYTAISDSNLRVLGIGLVFSRRRMGPDPASPVKIFDGPVWQEGTTTLENRIYLKQIFYMPVYDNK